jgi:O-antigen/teichoic acid export membrane protein
MSDVQPSLARRSITSVTWNTIAKGIILPVMTIQSIALARLLPVEYFGIFGGVYAVFMISTALFEFGLNGAFFHRAPEMLDEEQATAILFTLWFIGGCVCAALLAAGALILLSGLRQLTMLVFALAALIDSFASVPRTLLRRRVHFQRLAVLDLISNLAVFIATVGIAATAHSIWALLVMPIIPIMCTVILLDFWKPVWRPRFTWNKPVIKYYLNFGGRTVLGGVLGVALDFIDDLWTNIFLGDKMMGYYSRAYRFALLPRQILAESVNTVVSATYAELKFDRQRLSLAFFNANALMIRSGFLLGGWLAVIAPHFIRIFLGLKWMPMLDAFRLMLIFTLLDPIKTTILSALVAVGKPEKVSLARLFQFIVLIVGLFALGFRYQIAGVALAVDLMLVVGIGLALYYVKPYVDVSLASLFAVPTIALALGIALSWLASRAWNLTSTDWLAAIVKSLAFGLGYLAVSLVLEGKLLFRLAKRLS